jgi:hypothetical protein
VASQQQPANSICTVETRTRVQQVIGLITRNSKIFAGNKYCDFDLNHKIRN